MVSREVVILQDTADSLWDPPTSLFPSRAITTHKYKQVPEGGIQQVTHEKECYTPKKLHAFFQIIQIKALGICVQIGIEDVG